MHSLNPNWDAYSSCEYAVARFEKETTDGLAKGEIGYHVSSGHKWGNIHFSVGSVCLVSGRYDSTWFGLIVPGNLRCIMDAVDIVLNDQGKLNPQQLHSEIMDSCRKSEEIQKRTEKDIRKKYLS